MELEALAGRARAPGVARGADPGDVYAVEIAAGGGPFVVRTTDVIRGVVADLLAAVPPAVIAARFHATLAQVIAEACARIRDTTGLGRVALSGGVFQNAILLDWAVARLEAAGFEVYTHRQVPPNDGGLAVGQAAVAARRDPAT
jgi:hydrogenase maturation protein HypF